MALNSSRFYSCENTQEFYERNTQCSFYLEEMEFIISMMFHLSCPSAAAQLLFRGPGKSSLCVGREDQVCKRPFQFRPHSISTEQPLWRSVSLVPCCGVHSKPVTKRNLSVPGAGSKYGEHP